MVVSEVTLVSLAVQHCYHVQLVLLSWHKSLPFLVSTFTVCTAMTFALVVLATLRLVMAWDVLLCWTVMMMRCFSSTSAIIFVTLCLGISYKHQFYTSIRTILVQQEIRFIALRLYDIICYSPIRENPYRRVVNTMFWILRSRWLVSLS